MSARANRIVQALDALRGALPEAVATLLEIMRDRTMGSQTRLLACREILTRCAVQMPEPATDGDAVVVELESGILEFDGHRYIREDADAAN